MPAEDPQWYPSLKEFTHLYGSAGFEDIQVQLIPRPTPLPTGVRGWVKTFRSGWLEVAGVPQSEREAVAEAVQRRLAPKLQLPDGSWFADYIRLRFMMRKPV